MSVRRVIYLNESEYDFNDDFNESDELDFDDGLNEDMTLNEEESDGPDEPKPPMDDEKLRIESVKLATSIAKLMSNVTPEDIIKLSGIVATYIRNNNNAPDLEEGETTEDDFGDFGG